MSKKPPYGINPDRNVPWNNLPNLPIATELHRNIDILEALLPAKEAIAKLQGRSIAIPNPAMLITSISLQEAKASSEIENIFTTDDDLYQAYSDTQKDITGPAKEVLRYREAIWRGFTYLQTGTGFDLPYCLQLVQEIKQTQEGLRPPFAPVVIRQGGSGPQAGKTIYTPPRGAGILEAKLENLFTFLNNDEAYPLDPLLKMAIAHYQFEAIHPFRDGNGRVGRILNIHILTQKEQLDLPILFLSRYILEHKELYYSGLAGVSQRGDWKTWICFMLKAIAATATDTYHKINQILAARDAALAYLMPLKEFRRPEQLVLQIFSQPITRTKHLTQEGLYAENTARDYLNRLAEMGMLEKQTRHGHHYYLNRTLYDILGG
jgi:Fic family protein